MQDGEEHLRATARRPVARVSRASYESVLGMLGAQPGAEQLVTVTGDRGERDAARRSSPTCPTASSGCPARSFGRGVLAELASPGSTVTLKGATS